MLKQPFQQSYGGFETVIVPIGQGMKTSAKIRFPYSVLWLARAYVIPTGLIQYDVAVFSQAHAERHRHYARVHVAF